MPRREGGREGAAKVADFVAAEPGLQRHAKRLRDTLRDAAHTLAPDVEAALAAFDHHHLPLMRGILMERFGVSDLPTMPVN